MHGIYLDVDKTNTYLELTLKPDEVADRIDTKSLFNYIKETEFAKFYFYEDNLANAITSLRKSQKTNDYSPVVERIAERRNAEVKFQIGEGEMTAHLSMVSPYGGAFPSLQNLFSIANQAGIKRGLSRKRMQAMLEQMEQLEPGAVVEQIVAKGLPPRQGRSSKLKPLVPNALERILRPQESGGRVDMRNLGDIICIKAGTEVLRRLPPSKGRTGFTVTDVALEPKEGEWVKFRPGEGTVVSDHDENLLVADISGMPKFKNDKMWVDDTFICTGVNVGTGNIKYDGAVLVNGDVTEKMCIEAAGDVTVNGFVESAYIKAGGDIIITEGAMGKVNDAATEYSTQLIAEGSVHVQHGQGLDMSCNGNVTIGRQLAYTRIRCGGGVIVGPIDNPNGNLFACDIQAQEKVIAGTIGAVSGSNLSIDFSNGFNMLLERKDTLDDLLQQLRQNFARHKEKVDLIRSKYVPEELEDKVHEIMEMFKGENQLLAWLESKALEMRSSKEEYQQEIKLVANKRLYPGVVVKLNNRTWRADREYARAVVSYTGHQWQYDPLL